MATVREVAEVEDAFNQILQWLALQPLSHDDMRRAQAASDTLRQIIRQQAPPLPPQPAPPARRPHPAVKRVEAGCV